jgi:hypothetical protein
LRQNPDYQFGVDDDSVLNHPSNSGRAHVDGRENESVERGSNIRRCRQYEGPPEESPSRDGDSAAVSGDERVGGLSQTVNVASDECGRGSNDAPFHDSSCSFSKHVALLAIAKSRQMTSMPVETFEADADSDDNDDDVISEDDGRNVGDSDDDDVSASD